MPAPERKALQKTFRWVLVDKIQAFFRHPIALLRQKRGFPAAGLCKV